MTTSSFVTINVGAAPNDGTGDNLREAFIKVNNNFANITSNGENVGNLVASGTIDATGGITTGSDLSVSGNIYLNKNLTANSGIYAVSTYTGSYTDGVIVDYTTGTGRISVGSADGLTIYNGGLASTALLSIDQYGNTNVSGNLYAGGGNLQLQTNGFLYNSPRWGTQSLQQARGLVQSQQYFVLNSNVTIASATGDQKIFNVNAYVSSGTIYEFEAMFALVRAAGTTAHTISFNLGTGTSGLATFNWVNYQFLSSNAAPSISGATNITSTASETSVGFANVATNVVIATTTVTSALDVWAKIKGTFSVNSGGWISPKLALSAAPGGVYYTQAGSSIRISPLAVNGANVSIGSWA